MIKRKGLELYVSNKLRHLSSFHIVSYFFLLTNLKIKVKTILLPLYIMKLCNFDVHSFRVFQPVEP